MILVILVSLWVSFFLTRVNRTLRHSSSASVPLLAFLGITAFFTTGFLGLFLLYVTMGAAFSTPTETEFVNWVALLMYTGLEAGLFLACMVEAYFLKEPMWRKYFTLGIIGTVLFFTLFTRVSGYSFLFVIVLGWFAQLLYFRGERMRV